MFLAWIAPVTDLIGKVTPAERAACGNPPDTTCLVAFRATDSEVLAQVAEWVVAKPLKIVVIVLLAALVSRLVRRGIKRFVRSMEGAPASLLSTGPVQLRGAQRAETIGAVLRSIATASIWTIAVFMILAEFSINLGPLIAGAGIVGVAIGFGAQSLVRDFLSGMFMLVEDQFGVGDVIDVGEASGVVEGVSLRTTRIRSVDGTVWHVPNGEIHRVGNKSQQWSRALIDFQVAYDTDIPKAREVIKRVADEVWHDDELCAFVLEEPEVWGVENFGPDGVDIRLVMKTSPADQWKVMRELRQRMKAAFDAEGIEIPFPQRTVHVRPQGATLPGAEI
jgi:moderate conductance mechanosensitive channel